MEEKQKNILFLLELVEMFDFFPSLTKDEKMIVLQKIFFSIFWFFSLMKIEKFGREVVS